MHTHPSLLFFNSLSAQTGIKHFSTTRNGGVSDGLFQSFNLGIYSDDFVRNITKNRNKLAALLKTTSEKLIIPYQTHGNNVLYVNHEIATIPKTEQIKTIYGYDATITQEQGVFLCVTTADCTPVLLYDKVNKAIAAIHAGWRGVVNLIIDHTIIEMKKHFETNSKDLVAVIGPSIGIEKYEVGKEVVEKLKQAGYKLDETNHFVNPESNKFHIDPKLLNKQKLIALGVGDSQIEVSNHCTYSRKDLFFSARRQGVKSGRMLTGITLD